MQLLAVVAMATLATVVTPAQLAQKPQVSSQLNAALDAAAEALGMLRSVQLRDAIPMLEYRATGSMYALGQPFRPGMPWPQFKITSYRASIAYDVPGMRVELDRANPDGAVQGGGGLPQTCCSSPG